MIRILKLKNHYHVRYSNLFFALLILLPSIAYAQDCPNIDNDIARLACFDETYPSNNKEELSVLPNEILKAREMLKENAKDLTGMKFRNEIIYKNSKMLKGGQSVCGEVNGKNSYGGFSGFLKYYYTGTAVKIDDKTKTFKFMWNEMVCKNIK